MTPDPNRPHILLTNDDGIEADGLRAMAAALEPVADLSIVAPKAERSGSGHGITVFEDMVIEPFERGGRQWGWALSGMPADCVKVAATVLFRDRPIDMVVSGINRGQNAGINVIYSGTVAAAREAAILGLPAIAVSLFYRDEDHLPFETAARVGSEVMRRVLTHGLPKGIMLNVNVPPVAYEELQGTVVTRMGNSGYTDHYEDRPPEAASHAIVRNIGKGWNPSDLASNGLDDHALYADMVSITPIQIDMTAHDFLPQLQCWYGPGVE